MSNPIINPLWFYFIDVLKHLYGVTIAIIVFSGAFVLVGSIIYFCWRSDSYNENYEDDVKLNTFYQRMLKRTATILVISILLNTVIPTETTLYTMLISNYVTQENVELTGDAIKDMVDYVFEKVDELGE